MREPVQKKKAHDSSLRAALRRGHFTSLDFVLLSIYPLTLFLGFCFSIGHSESYFAYSRNIFNLIFVKNGWLWTSIVFWMHTARLSTTVAEKRQAVSRWAVATLIWILVTQWAFGAPLTDRTMIWSGGVCELAEEALGKSEGLTEQIAILTNKACKESRGHWVGGHDLSGHVFILTHSSLFIWYEILPLLLEDSKLLQGNISRSSFVLLAGWWWMLLMTAAYFHTWKEKLTGLVAGLSGWFLIYKIIPGFRVTRRAFGSPTA